LEQVQNPLKLEFLKKKNDFLSRSAQYMCTIGPIEELNILLILLLLNLKSLMIYSEARQKRYSPYKVNSRRVRLTIVAVEKQ